jgi:hypothetical protein
MSRTRSPARFLLDTSAVVFHLHGHTLQQLAVSEALAGGQVLAPVFVRMEYLRAVILNLIEMWCLIRESVTVDDAFVDWSQKVRQERKLKVILLTVPHWLSGHEVGRSKDVTLRRLGDLVLRLIWEFDEAFPTPPEDPLAYVLGQCNVPRQSYDDDMLLDFYQRFTAVQESVPACRLCDFRKAQRRRLGRSGINLADPVVRARFASNRGFIDQSEQIEQAANTKEVAPACRWCERLGDTIIALQAQKGVAIVSADRTFVPLGEVLGRVVVMLPSLAKLKQATENPSE